MSHNPERNTQVSDVEVARASAPTENGRTAVEGEGAAPIPVEGLPQGMGSRTQAAEPAADLGELLRKAEAEAADLRDAFLRAKAETENVRKQAQNDIVKAHKYATERFAQELLTVRDALELALATPHDTIEALRDGVELTLKNLNAAFEKARIVEINPVGERYDPHRHQAMTMIESDQPAGTVVQVFQKGYLLNDRVLRPALVAVAKGREGSG
jgi:molecular chaperone GrpE